MPLSDRVNVSTGATLKRVGGRYKENEINEGYTNNFGRVREIVLH